MKCIAMGYIFQVSEFTIAGFLPGLNAELLKPAEAWDCPLNPVLVAPV
jgi:hypothetical protein